MSRADRLYPLLEESHLAALALVPGPNMRYLAGLEMHPSERVSLAIFSLDKPPALLLPALEVPGVRARMRQGLELFPWTDEEGPGSAIRRLREYLALAGGNLGVEERHMRLLEWHVLEQIAPDSQVRTADALLAELRMTKDAVEIAAMRQAAAVLEQGLQTVLERLRPGMNERQAAQAWQWAVAEAGADELPPEPIVAAGLHGASPHARATDRPLQNGDFVTFDGVARIDGYYADLTRTVALGEPGEKLRQIYDLVLQANTAGREAVRAGIAAQAVDQAARAVIEAGGYGDYFIHRTGHGLGLEVHEPPYIVAGNVDPIRTGMTFTVEPGIYIEGLGGVRIEDDVLVTPAGGDSLTTFTRDLLVL